MMREVQGIPPAPRRVRWHRPLAYRWPLLALTFLLAANGGLWTWMLFLAFGGKLQDSQRLDLEPRLTVTATVTEARRLDGQDTDEVRYRFAFTGSDGVPSTNGQGQSFAPAGRIHADDEVTVEYLPAEPHINRIVGLKAHQLPSWTDPMLLFRWMVVPGLVVGAYYLIGVLHLRHILRRGDVGVAQVLGVKVVPCCLPETLSVRFVFRDHRAHVRMGRHWVRAHSALGLRLRRQAEQGSFDRVPVLHDRRLPRYCRLVLPEDFAPDSNARGQAATIPS